MFPFENTQEYSKPIFFTTMSDDCFFFENHRTWSPREPPWEHTDLPESPKYSSFHPFLRHRQPLTHTRHHPSSPPLLRALFSDVDCVELSPTSWAPITCVQACLRPDPRRHSVGGWCPSVVTWTVFGGAWLAATRMLAVGDRRAELETADSATTLWGGRV